MSDYLLLSPALKRAVKRNKHHVVVELYKSDVNDIFSDPSKASYRFANLNLTWQENRYEGKLLERPPFEKFISKQFNSMTFALNNVWRGRKSPSFIVLNNVIKGYRVALRVIAPRLPISESWIIWSGRLDSIADISKERVTINCTQELGKFSYQVATDVYGQACPLRFGFGDCLGYESLEEKSPTYRRNFELFGHGGCDKTFAACTANDNTPLNQGQRAITTGGTFNRPEVVKKRNWWTLGLTKKKKLVNVPVQWSPKNQDDNNNEPIGIAFGRVSRQGNVFTSADVGGQLIGLVGFLRAGKYGIEGFYQVESADEQFPVIAYTQHLGTLGGIGTQMPDPRFLESGYNSKLAYLGVTLADTSDDPLSNQPNEFPTISSIIKANLVDVFDGERWTAEWSHNPVWIARYLMTDYPYTVVRPEWFNDFKNLETAQKCYRIVEDDTESEIARISSNEVQAYNDGALFRYHSSGRYNGHYLPESDLPDPTIDRGDIDFFPILNSSGGNLSKTFLQFQYTFNGVINETASLMDVLYGLVFPTFRGYLGFDREGRIFIGTRTAAPNTYVRTDWFVSGSNFEPNKVPVTNVSKIGNSTQGYLLIGAGQPDSEIRRQTGVEYIHVPTDVAVNVAGVMSATSTNFQSVNGGPSRATITLQGNAQLGDRITITLTTPIVGQLEPRVLQWDWIVEGDTSLDKVAQMVKTRLEASMLFEEFWTCRIDRNNNSRLILECQCGFVRLDKSLTKDRIAGEEIIRVSEVYENFKDADNDGGRRDNLFDFTINQGTEQYQGVKSVYTSAIEGFTEVEVLPETAWASVEEEREMNLLELDLRNVDNYWQTAYLTKAAQLDFVVGGLYGTLRAPWLGVFHPEDDVIAVKYHTLEGVGYLPMTVVSVGAGDGIECTLGLKLYLSAVFDRRVSREEKRVETSITQTPNGNIEPDITRQGGYSTTRTGNGAADSPQSVLFSARPYKLLPKRYQTDGSRSEVNDRVINYKPLEFDLTVQETSSSSGAGLAFQSQRKEELVGFVPTPLKVDVELLSDNSARITWNWVQLLNPKTVFIVEIFREDYVLQFLTTRDTEITAVSLPYDSQLDVRVRAETARGTSPWSEVVTFTTTGPAYLTDNEFNVLTTDGVEPLER